VQCLDGRDLPLIELAARKTGIAIAVFKMVCVRQEEPPSFRDVERKWIPLWLVEDNLRSKEEK
jgi:hypothetical protein